MIFFTSDLHIGHAKVAELRGFDVQTNGVVEPWAEGHAAFIADYWDETVKKDDIVFILGDTGIGRFEQEVLPWFDARPGIKHLIAGNHDPIHPARSDAIKLQPRWLRTFATINAYATKKIAGEKVMLSHFPYQSYGDGSTHGDPEGRWNEWRIPEELGKLLIHGHTHGPETEHDGNQFHAGWDAWNEFVSFDIIEGWVKSVRPH